MITWKQTPLPAFIVMLFFGTNLIVACSSVDREPTALPVPTAISISPESILSPTTNSVTNPEPTQPPSAAPQPTIETDGPLVNPTAGLSLSPTPTTISSPAITPILQDEESYRVAYVAADDVLNIRSGPGAENQILGVLLPDAAGIRMSGRSQLVSGTSWVWITTEQQEGWVNNRYLTGEIDSASFCQDPYAAEILVQLKTAIDSQDSALLAQITHPERGLRVRSSWWNPEVKLSKIDIDGLFERTSSYEWGVEDGSGLKIEGTFQDVIVPHLQNDLLGAANINCNRLEHGPTTGIVKLPDGYQGINYYGFYRPANDELGFDWGTWAVGIEKWQSQYFLSFLVHYRYEI